MTIYYTNHLEKLLKLYPDKEWDYKYLSQNPNITWDNVQNNPDKPWNYYWLSSNPNITWNNVKNQYSFRLALPLKTAYFFQTPKYQCMSLPLQLPLALGR